MLESYYKMLGLDSNASIDEIRNKYLELTEVYYTNLEISNKKEKFTKINLAYHIININLSKMSNYNYKLNYDINNNQSIPFGLREYYITKANHDIKKIENNCINIYELFNLYQLQYRIITTKYKIQLEKLLSKKISEKHHNFLFYYFAPKWKNNFERKYNIQKRILYKKFKKDLSLIIDKIYLQKIRIEKNLEYINYIKNSINDLSNLNDNLEYQSKQKIL